MARALKVPEVMPKLVNDPHQRHLVAVIRYVLGLGPRDYARPLWERALETRKVRS